MNEIDFSSDVCGLFFSFGTMDPTSPFHAAVQLWPTSDVQYDVDELHYGTIIATRNMRTSRSTLRLLNEDTVVVNLDSPLDGLDRA